MKKLKLEELNRLSEEEFKKAKKNPVVLILDNIRSLHNVGSAFRTADAFRVEKLFICGITGQPPHREIHKTALGATETVDWEHVQEAQEVILKLKREGWKIICMEQTDSSLPLQQFKPEANKKYAFVFGNEVFGVNEALIEKADLCIEIPQFGTKHSLNVSVSIGILCWHYTFATIK
jgi:23S rRNA (guanosine2251-2'-O)-methyltransferase